MIIFLKFLKNTMFFLKKYVIYIYEYKIYNIIIYKVLIFMVFAKI